MFTSFSMLATGHTEAAVDLQFLALTTTGVGLCNGWEGGQRRVPFRAVTPQAGVLTWGREMDHAGAMRPYHNADTGCLGLFKKDFAPVDGIPG